MLSSKSGVSNWEEGASGLLSNLRLKIPLSKVPVLGDILF